MIPQLTPPRWMSSALCAQVDTELFFPDIDESNREAKLICQRCDVQEACLAYAVNAKIPFGVWGGKSDRERRNLRRAS
jgi:WhiB family redox-sensing transcriptional regulator